ncbi:MAG: hypothetical protein ACOH5I_15620 [Oligoflexus sp.]
MPDLSFADYYNLFIHLLFLIVYGLMVYYSLRFDNLTTDENKLSMIHLSPAAAVIGGTMALVAGSIMLIFWIYFMISSPSATIQNQTSTIFLHAATEFLAAIFLLIAGYAMFRRWAHAFGMYLISISILITTTIFSMIAFEQDPHPIAMDIVALSLSSILTIAIGLTYSAQFFSSIRFHKKS